MDRASSPIPLPEAGLWRARLDEATSGLDPVFAVVDLDAFEANAADMRRRAGALPIRVASKSVRCRALLALVLKGTAFTGLLAYSLPEALWLATDDPGADWVGVPDVVVGYPSADRGALLRLAGSSALRARVTLMVDDLAQVALVIAAAREAGADTPIRLCLDLDASYRPGPGDRIHLGVRRSPLHTPADIARFTALAARIDTVRIVGVMSYEAQIAGMGDAARTARGAAVRQIQKRSAGDLAVRRRAAVAAVEAELVAARCPALEFVNGGGTGSLESTTAEGACTELAAGSGFFGPTLFDNYRVFRPVPAMSYATAVVRRPAPGLVTVHSGGFPASGPAGASRLPTPWLPAGLAVLGGEGAGEVQTPLAGPVADSLAIGDRVWFRHAKAGEACERFDILVLVRGVTGPGAPRTEGQVRTYRGESRNFG